MPPTSHDPDQLLTQLEAAKNRIDSAHSSLVTKLLAPNSPRCSSTILTNSSASTNACFSSAPFLTRHLSSLVSKNLPTHLPPAHRETSRRPRRHVSLRRFRYFRHRRHHHAGRSFLRRRSLAPATASRAIAFRPIRNRLERLLGGLSLRARPRHNLAALHSPISKKMPMSEANIPWQRWLDSARGPREPAPLAHPALSSNSRSLPGSVPSSTIRSVFPSDGDSKT